MLQAALGDPPFATPRLVGVPEGDLVVKMKKKDAIVRKSRSSNRPNNQREENRFK